MDVSVPVRAGLVATFVLLGALVVAPSVTATSCHPIAWERDTVVVGPFPVEFEYETEPVHVPVEVTTPGVETPDVHVEEGEPVRVLFIEVRREEYRMDVPDVEEHTVERDVRFPGQPFSFEKEFGPYTIAGDRPTLGDFDDCTDPAEPIVERVVAEVEEILGQNHE